MIYTFLKAISHLYNFVYIYRKLNHISTLFIIRNTKLQIYVYQTCKGLKIQIFSSNLYQITSKSTAAVIDYDL